MCVTILASETQLWTAGAGAGPVVTYGEKQEKVFLSVQITWVGITWKG